MSMAIYKCKESGYEVLDKANPVRVNISLVYPREELIVALLEPDRVCCCAFQCLFVSYVQIYLLPMAWENTLRHSVPSQAACRTYRLSRPRALPPSISLCWLANLSRSTNACHVRWSQAGTRDIASPPVHKLKLVLDIQPAVPVLPPARRASQHLP